MPRGYLDTSHIDFPVGLDQTYVTNLENRVGVSFARVLALIDGRLATASANVDPLVAATASFTPGVSTEIPATDSFSLEEEDEYGLARPELGEAPKAHMLPFRRYRKAIGFTEEFLDAATEPQILRQVDTFLRTFTRGLTTNVLTRFWSADEVYVDRGTVTKSPGYAGSGTGDNVFSATYPEGTAIPAGYTHYYRDTAANRAALIRSMRDRLAKWHAAPFDLVGSAAEIAAIMALGEAGGFVRATSDLILRAQGVAAANVDNARYVGVFDNDIRVWLGRNELGTSPNFAVFKSYGDFDVRNPIAIRYDPVFGRGIDIQYRDLYPLANAFMRQRYGAGVGNRVGAALARIDAAAGAYIAPTLVV